MIRLYYQGQGPATVAVDMGYPTPNTNSFMNIDMACDFLLESLQVPDEVIDDAIIQLHANSHTVATFTPERKLLKTGFY